MSDLYVIKGQTGEYSDRTTWTVEAHLSLVKATIRLDFLNGELTRLGLNKENSDWSEKERAEIEMIKNDGLFRCFQTSRYFIETIPLVD